MKDDKPAKAGSARVRRKIWRIWLSGDLHLSASFEPDGSGWQGIVGFGRIGVWVLALVGGWARWPHLSFGTLDCRVGLGEWQSDPAGSVHGLGPFWFTRPPRVAP